VHRSGEIQKTKDHQGALWLGSHNAGALKLGGKTFEKFKP